MFLNSVCGVKFSHCKSFIALIIVVLLSTTHKFLLKNLFYIRV